MAAATTAEQTSVNRKGTADTGMTSISGDTTTSSLSPAKKVCQASPVLLGLLCAAAAVEGGDQVLLPAVSFALQKDLDVTLSNLAAMNLAQALAMSAVAPFWGILADRQVMSRKSLLILGAVIQGFITVVLAFVDDVGFMVALRALNGAMLAGLRPVAIGVIADVTSESSRGKVYGWMQLTFNLGMCIGSITATPLSTRTVLGHQGWRVAFVLFGAASMTVAALMTAFLVEPPREAGVATSQPGNELRRLFSYFRMPTFGALVVQGCFGCIPWNALGYSTLFFQVGGINDFAAALLQALGQVAGALGNLLGGVVGDAMARRCRDHGRPFAAQISVLAGIPIAYFTFMVLPPSGYAFPYYLALVVALGLSATWCAAGVNWPILSEIVSPDNRSAIMAWETALEGSTAAVLGNTAVGFLAEHAFGYDLDVAKEGDMNSDAAEALGKALMLTSFGPWIVCLIFYTLLHWSLPRDLKRLDLERAAKVAGEEELAIPVIAVNEDKVKVIDDA